VPLTSRREDVRGRGGKVEHSLNIGMRWRKGRLGLDVGKTTIDFRGIDYENVNWTEFVYCRRRRLVWLLTCELHESGKFIDCVPNYPLKKDAYQIDG